MNYYANWQYDKNGNDLLQQVPGNTLTKSSLTNVEDDNCYIQNRDVQNNQRMKYYTSNYIDLLDAKMNKNFFSINLQDTLFMPGPDRINQSSQLRQGQQGGQLTQCKNRNGFGQLPFLTMPSKYQLNHNSEHLDLEYNMRNIDYDQSLSRNACLPRDTQYYQRHFQVFDDQKGIQTPRAMDSVETPECGFLFQRIGEPTRNIGRQYNNLK